MEFGTFTDDLNRLKEWLIERECPVVAMERTAPYWTPVHNILEGFFQVILVNARHMRNVPRVARLTCPTVDGLRVCCVMSFSRRRSFRLLHINPVVSSICLQISKKWPIFFNGRVLISSN